MGLKKLKTKTFLGIVIVLCRWPPSLYIEIYINIDRERVYGSLANCSLHIWQNDWSLLPASTRLVMKLESAEKVNSGENSILLHLPGVEPATFFYQEGLSLHSTTDIYPCCWSVCVWLGGGVINKWIRTLRLTTQGHISRSSGVAVSVMS